MIRNMEKTNMEGNTLNKIYKQTTVNKHIQMEPVYVKWIQHVAYTI